ncbi:IclR family transcriptional regulator [Paractinoplanes abujensis]|uniref:DNA-binding IclR family transcriptional regulator n=1 Tax=Paractinoplanes abujensis TaxID=882441 RepID=A0A7W7CS78_9ACTN|nr:IclR family transcriptional regulator [Actinoplanes abujensis]MBB4693718.1 DNA-binding IclR family transcriptional regulator [Actinoplanes abujensis]GID21625.1 IclR family transcriptional regulator [Actinoplanes abujensis]
MSVVGKVSLILDAFTAEDRGIGFAELQRRTGLAKATLHRLSGEMVDARLLDRVDGKYHLSGHLFALGMRASVERSLIEVATPFLEDLYERTHETVHLGRREGTEVVYVAKIGGHRQARAPSRLGGRLPLHATAIGKALLAFAPDPVRAEVLARPLERLAPRTVTSAALLRRQLDEAAETGLTYEAEESAVGIVCVGAPVLDADDVAVAAISVAGPSTRFQPQKHGAAVKAAAAEIAITLARRSA